MVPERVPGMESVLARDHRLGVMQRERRAVEGFVRGGRERGERTKSHAGAGFVAPGGLEQVLRLPLELVEVGTRRQLLGCHTTSMLGASGPQAGQHGDSRAVIQFGGVDSVLRADPRAPRAHAEMMGMGGLAVKRATTPNPGGCQGSAPTSAPTDRRPTVNAVPRPRELGAGTRRGALDRKSTRLNSSHRCISYAVF